jgi:hypothetical protein
MEMVTVVGPVETEGGDIRPLVGEPLEHAFSQTRMCSSTVSGPGGGNAGSSAHAAAPNSGGMVAVVVGASGSGETGQEKAVATGPVVATHPAAVRASVATITIDRLTPEPPQSAFANVM